jgi:hypothetical protein
MTIIYMVIYVGEDSEARTNLSHIFCGSWVYLTKRSASVRFATLLGRAEQKNQKRLNLLLENLRMNLVTLVVLAFLLTKSTTKATTPCRLQRERSKVRL